MTKSHHSRLLCFYIGSATFAAIAPLFRLFMRLYFTRFIREELYFLFSNKEKTAGEGKPISGGERAKTRRYQAYTPTASEAQAIM